MGLFYICLEIHHFFVVHLDDMYVIVSKDISLKLWVWDNLGFILLFWVEKFGFICIFLSILHHVFNHY